jgi:hypothetical protein
MRNKIRRLFAAAFVAAVSAFGVVAVQSPALATWSDCAAYNDVVCFHQYGNFTGQVWRQRTGQFPTGCRNFAPENFENKASTAFNRTTNYQLRVYSGPSCTGEYVGLRPGNVQSFVQTNTWFDNRASSARVTFIG